MANGVIFPDDAPLDARRETAVARLLALCPTMLRPSLRPLVVSAVSNASEAQLAALLLDVDRVQTCAESGDFAGVVSIARSYGATDAQVAQVQAMLPGISSGESHNT